jgi:hypothetical protein
VDITYDPAKNERNIRERQLSFDRAADFDFANAIVGPIFRNGEWRTVATGYLEDRLHVLCFKKTDGLMRVISFRKANAKEGERHGLKLRR